MEDWQREQEEARRRDETFRRISKLVARGYRPDWNDVSDAIWFEHPGSGPRVIVYSDGMIVGLGSDTIMDPTANEDRDRIHNGKGEDHDNFDRWLSSVELPTWRQRTHADREKYIYVPGCMILLFVVTILLGQAATWIWNQLFG